MVRGDHNPQSQRLSLNAPHIVFGESASAQAAEEVHDGEQRHEDGDFGVPLRLPDLSEVVDHGDAGPHAAEVGHEQQPEVRLHERLRQSEVLPTPRPSPPPDCPLSHRRVEVRAVGTDQQHRTTFQII